MLLDSWQWHKLYNVILIDLGDGLRLSELWQYAPGVFFGDERDKVIFKEHILNADLARDPFQTFVITHFDCLSDVTKPYELFLLRTCKVAR